MQRNGAFALAAAISALTVTSVHASENGLEHYPIGVNTVADSLLPPPGMLQLQNYTVGSWANQTNDGAGRAAPVSFKLRSEADAARFLYTWNGVKVGPFNYTTGVVATLVHSAVDAAGTHGDQTNFGDFDVQNYLSYASPDHAKSYFIGLDVYAPTASYDKNKLVNIGNNYWTFGPNVAATYKITPKLELTALVMAQFNTANPATHYHSGDDIDLDFGTSYYAFDKLPKLAIGIQGYFYQQFEDDRQYNLVVAPDGHRGREFGIGPQIRYDLPFGGVILKYQHEYAVENRPQAEKVWLEVAVPLYGKPKG